MHEQLLIFAGPGFALLTLLLFAVPSIRPMALRGLIGWIAVAMLIPIGIAYATHSINLGTLAFVVRPIVAIAGVTLSVGYFMICRDRRFPTITALPSVLMLFGAVTDLYSVYILGPLIGGGGC